MSKFFDVYARVKVEDDDITDEVLETDVRDLLEGAFVDPMSEAAPQYELKVETISVENA